MVLVVSVCFAFLGGKGVSFSISNLMSEFGVEKTASSSNQFEIALRKRKFCSQRNSKSGVFVL